MKKTKIYDMEINLMQFFHRQKLFLAFLQFSVVVVSFYSVVDESTAQKLACTKKAKMNDVQFSTQCTATNCYQFLLYIISSSRFPIELEWNF